MKSLTRDKWSQLKWEAAQSHCASFYLYKCWNKQLFSCRSAVREFAAGYKRVVVPSKQIPFCSDLSPNTWYTRPILTPLGAHTVYTISPTHTVPRKHQVGAEFHQKLGIRIRQGDKKEDVFLLCAMIHLIHRDTSDFFKPHPDWRLPADSGQLHGRSGFHWLTALQTW